MRGKYRKPPYDTGTLLPSIQVAPPPRPPEFQDTVMYLTDLSIRWKLHNAGVVDVVEEIDLAFLARWEPHSQTLNRYRAPNWATRETVGDVCRFVDALVGDLQRALSGQEPNEPLDADRIEELGNLRNRLQNIPGDKWEIKY